MSYLLRGIVDVGNEVEISNDVDNPIPVTVENDTDNPIPVDITNATITQTVVPGAVDAFGKLRISQPTTLGDYHHVGGENPEMLLSASGSGTGSVDVATSSYILSVGTGNGDYAVHQSRMYHHYLPGKSQLILESFCLGSPRANTVKRCGYFDDRNGIFFQQAGDGSLSFVMRTYVSGSPVDTVINQSAWNVDTCNTSIQGTGVLPNGSNALNHGKVGTWTLDPTKTQLLMTDFQWLGVGRIRIGFVHDGQWVIAHEIYNSNYGTNVYWTQPRLPIRCEIRNVGVAVGTATMKQICATVLSEGGYIETGLVNTRSSSLTGRIIANGGSSLPMVAIRLKNSFNGDLVRGIVRALQSSVIATNGSIYFELVRFENHTSVTGGSWVSHGDDSIVEYNITATGYSGGIAVSSQFVEAAANKSSTGSGFIANPATNKRGFITQNYDSSSSECYAICVTVLGNQNNINVSAYAALQWSETK